MRPDSATSTANRGIIRGYTTSYVESNFSTTEKVQALILDLLPPDGLFATEYVIAQVQGQLDVWPARVLAALKALEQAGAVRCFYLYGDDHWQKVS